MTTETTDFQKMSDIFVSSGVPHRFMKWDINGEMFIVLNDKIYLEFDNDGKFLWAQYDGLNMRHPGE